MNSIIGYKFINAIENNNTDDLRALLTQYSPDIKFKEGYTPLMLCCGESKHELAKILLEHNANIDIVNDQGTCALKVAVIKEDIKMIDILKDYAPEPNIIDTTGYTPLMYAIKNESVKIIDLLLALGADPYLKNTNKENSSIDMARYIGNEDIINKVEKQDLKNEFHIDDLIGQEKAKQQLQEIISLCKINKEREKNDLPKNNVSFHSVYFGNPGTGKTTFARFFAQEIKKLGLLKKGHLVEVTRSNLIAKYTGHTAEKTNEVFKSALDGILFIDEAYSLKNSDDDNFGQECIDTLITLIENNRDRIIVILAGYKDEMKDFLHINTGLKSRIPNIVEFDDFSNTELKAIFKKFLEKSFLKTNEDNIDYSIREVSKKRSEKSFGNAREVRNLIDRSIIQQSVRLSKIDRELSIDDLKTLIYSDFTLDPNDHGTIEIEKDSHSKTTEESFMPLDQLIGLKEVKSEINQIIDFAKIAKLRSPNKLPELGLHMIFTGNPGTGKTTVARILGKIFHSLDLLSSGHTVEVDRSMLVAPFVGQTAIKTKEMLDKALGGVLFIDEAYSLYRSNNQSGDFGVEAIDTILKYMEDNKGKLIIILAGYPKEMDVFLQSNSGLSSRFDKTLNFEDFNEEELIEIAKLMAKKKNYELAEDAIEKMKDKFLTLINSDHFGNARDVRKILETSFKKQASRLVNESAKNELSKKDLNTIKASDIEV